jgi:hypothetical protein
MCNTNSFSQNCFVVLFCRLNCEKLTEQICEALSVLVGFFVFCGVFLFFLSLLSFLMDVLS